MKAETLALYRKEALRLIAAIASRKHRPYSEERPGVGTAYLQIACIANAALELDQIPEQDLQ